MSRHLYTHTIFIHTTGVQATVWLSFCFMINWTSGAKLKLGLLCPGCFLDVTLAVFQRQENMWKYSRVSHIRLRQLGCPGVLRGAGGVEGDWYFIAKILLCWSVFPGHIAPTAMWSLLHPSQDWSVWWEGALSPHIVLSPYLFLLNTESHREKEW